MRYSAIVVLLVGATVTVAVLQAGKPTDLAERIDPQGAYNVTEDGTKYTVHPDELLRGCPSKDCIPSIDDPSFVSASAADAWLKPGDVVMGLEINGDVRAYPLRILERHEIVNDVVGGEPVAVTYCPLCRSGVVHSRELAGRTLSFGVSGWLLNANLVMYDRQTGTLWSQIGGRAIVGPLVPAELELYHAAVVRWEDWKQGHPETRVLSRQTGIYPASSYDELLYKRYHQRPSVGFGVEEPEGPLHSKEIVYGIETADAARAYPEALLRNETLVNDKVGSTPILIFESPDDGAIMAFERRIDGTTLSFRLVDGKLTDSNGNTWALNGTALEGRYRGRQLDRYQAHGFYWFAWQKFHEETTVYMGEG